MKLNLSAKYYYIMPKRIRLKWIYADKSYTNRCNDASLFPEMISLLTYNKQFIIDFRIIDNSYIHFYVVSDSDD